MREAILVLLGSGLVSALVSFGIYAGVMDASRLFGPIQITVIHRHVSGREATEAGR